MYGMDFAPQFYAMNDDGKMSVDALADVEGTILGFKAGTTDDVYTISFDCGEYTDMLYLYDMDMDIYTPVTNEDTYTFATTDKNEHQRFILTRNRMPEVTTGVDAIDVDGEKSVKATKFIHNEKIYILYRGVVYDMNGKRVIRK